MSQSIQSLLRELDELFGDDEDESSTAQEDADAELARHPFILAIISGLDEDAALMLAREPDLARKRYAHHRTALMCAAINGNLAMLAELLPLSDPKATDRHGDSALSLAAVAGFVDAVEFLIPHSDLSQVDEGDRDAAEVGLLCSCNDPFHWAHSQRPRGPGLALEGQPPAPGGSRIDRVACFRLLAPHCPRAATQTSKDGTPWIAQLFEFDRAALARELASRNPPSPQEASAFLALAAHDGASACVAELLNWADPEELAPALDFVPRSLRGRRALEIAIDAKRVHVVDALLRHSPQLARLPGAGTWPIIRAAASPDTRILASILPLADLEAIDSQGRCALAMALRHQNLAGAKMIAQALRERGLSPSPRCLGLAMACANQDIASWFLQSFPLAPRELGLPHPETALTPLEQAIAHKLWAPAQALLDFNAPAAVAGRPDALAALARQRGVPKAFSKALIRASSAWLCTPLHDGSDAFQIACSHGNAKLAKRLAKAIFASSDRPANWAARAWRELSRAATSRAWKKTIVVFKPWIDSLDPDALNQLLIHACAKACPIAASLLLDAGADANANANAARANGTFALRAACESSRHCPARSFETIQALLARGADPLRRSHASWSQSPLGFALFEANAPAFDAMLRALPHPLPREASDALFLLGAKKGHLAIVQSLLAAIPKSDDWPRDALGCCPLMICCAAGQSSLVELLAPLCPRPLATDALGRSPLALFLASQAWRHPHFEPALLALLVHPGAFDALSPSCVEAARRSPIQWAAIETALLRLREREALELIAAQPLPAKAASRL